MGDTVHAPEHTKEIHLQRLNCICRICGERTRKTSDVNESVVCVNYAAAIASTVRHLC